jgi:hypothetical protein
MTNLVIITAALVAVIIRHVMSPTKISAVSFLSFLRASTLNMKKEDHGYESW